MKDEPEFYALKPLSPTEHVVRRWTKGSKAYTENTTKPWFLIAEEHRNELPPITIALFYGGASVIEKWTLYHFDSLSKMGRYFVSHRIPFRSAKLFLRGMEYELPSGWNDTHPYSGPYFLRIDGQDLKSLRGVVDLHNAFYGDSIEHG